MGVSNWLKNLPLRGKFALLSALAMLMLALPSARLLQDDWRTWQVAEREAAGIAPATELLRWVRLSQQHRGLSAGLLAGDRSQADARAAKQAQAEASAKRLLSALAPFERAGLPKQTGELQQQAQALMQAVAQQQLDGAQSLRRHGELIDQQLRLLQDLAQASGLALDPQPALLNLQAGVLTQLPRLTELLGQLRVRGTRALGGASIAAEERARIETRLEQAQQLVTQVQRTFDLALAARPRELAPLAIPLADARKAALAALALSQVQLVEGQQPSLKPADFYAQQTQQIDRQFALMDRALELLREQVLAQAGAARQAIAMLLGSLLLLSALAGWILWRVAAHTHGAIGQAVGLAQAVAEGDLRREVDVSSRDEAG